MNSRRKPYALWIELVPVAIVLIPAGGAKLAGVPQLRASFAALGRPPWFGYFIGACEVLGAIGIFFRRVSLVAATGIAVIMLGALYFHATHTPLVQGLPAFIVLVLCLFVMATRWRAASAAGRGKPSASPAS